MTDVHEPEVRSYNMSRIRGKDTKPEMIVRKFLFKNGFRYRLYDKKLPGKPDIVLSKYKTVIFIHGCFWHGHEGCKYYVIPKTRTAWWVNKIQNNKDRDILKSKELRKKGWNVIGLFECEITKGVSDNTLESNLLKLKKLINERKS